MTLTRKKYYATLRTISSKRGAIHEAQNCTALCKAWQRSPIVGPGAITQKQAAALIESSKRKDGRKMVFLCSRCKGMK